MTDKITCTAYWWIDWNGELDSISWKH